MQTAFCVRSPGGAAYVSSLARLSAPATVNAVIGRKLPGATVATPAYAYALVYPNSSKVYPDPSNPLRIPAITWRALAPRARLVHSTGGLGTH